MKLVTDVELVRASNWILAPWAYAWSWSQVASTRLIANYCQLPRAWGSTDHFLPWEDPRPHGLQITFQYGRGTGSTWGAGRQVVWSAEGQVSLSLWVKLTVSRGTGSSITMHQVDGLQRDRFQLPKLTKNKRARFTNITEFKCHYAVVHGLYISIVTKTNSQEYLFLWTFVATSRFISQYPLGPRLPSTVKLMSQIS